MTGEWRPPSSIMPVAVREWTARRVITATVIVLTVGVGFFLLYRFRWALFSLFVAIVLGTAVRPVVDWLERRRIARWTAAVLVYLAVLAVVIATLALLVPMIVEQVTTLSARLPAYYHALRGWMLESSSRTLRHIGSELPVSVAAAGAPGRLMPQTTGWLASLGHVAFTLVSVLVLGFYWTLEGRGAIEGMLRLAPRERRAGVRQLVIAAESKVGAYVRGQVIICLTVGVFQGLAYLILGVPYALVLGLIAAIMEAVPIVGPTLGAVPAALIALSISPTLFLGVAISTLVVQLLESYVLVPRMMDRSVGVNPVVTLLSIAGFSAMMGLAGALLAIPMAAILQLLFAKVLHPPRPPVGKSAMLKLRSEATSLAREARAMHENEADDLAAMAIEIEHLLAAQEAHVAGRS